MGGHNGEKEEKVYLGIETCDSSLDRVLILSDSYSMLLHAMCVDGHRVDYVNMVKKLTESGR
jgi:hypothetical protein